MELIISKPLYADQWSGVYFPLSAGFKGFLKASSNSFNSWAKFCSSFLSFFCFSAIASNSFIFGYNILTTSGWLFTTAHCKADQPFESGSKGSNISLPKYFKTNSTEPFLQASKNLSVSFSFWSSKDPRPKSSPSSSWIAFFLESIIFLFVFY